MEFDYEEPIEKRFEDLCQDLGMEGAIREEAWEKYKDVWANYSIDGDQIQWLVCSLYECCRRSIAESLSGHIVENAYVSLSRLLSAAKMSMVQFFHRIRKWADMTDMVDEMRDRVELLERQFAVSSVIFRNFGRSFGVLFHDIDFDKAKVHPTTKDLFRFTWLLFIKSRANFPAVTDDLVNSYHLLVCCLDWVVGMTMLSHRAVDLINLDFTGFPKDFVLSVKQQHPSWSTLHDEPICMLRPICEDNDVNYVECKTVKEYFFCPFMQRLLEKDLIKIHPSSYGTLLESENFSATLQNLNNSYEEYIIGTGDFDERVYLSPNAAEEIGSTGENGVSQSDLQLSSDLAPSARRYMLELSNSGFGGFTETTRRGNANAGAISRLSGGVNFNNTETRLQNLNQLQILLRGRSKEPSEALIGLMDAHCTVSPLVDMQNNLSELGAEFQRAYTGSGLTQQGGSSAGMDDVANNLLNVATSAAQQRLSLGFTFYYMALENILMDEVRRFEKRAIAGPGTIPMDEARRTKPDLTPLLSQDLFHRSLFACCMELVLLSCDSAERHFPWILDSLNLDALHFFKVIEVLIRNVDFPRDVVKYMSQVAELILDSYAWRSCSPLWLVIKASGRAPSIEEVIAPEKLDQSRGGSMGTRVATDRSGAIPMKQPRFLSHTAPGNLLRGRPLQMTSGSRRHMITDDESAQATAELLASGVTTEVIDPSEASLLNVPSEDLTNLDDKSENTLLSDSTVLWTSSGSNLTNYYPTRHDSLSIFFRQVYYMASIRLRDLCERLNLSRDVLAKIWTCVEHVIVHETNLLLDRCLDQILLCCVYSVCKVVLCRPLTFIDVIQVYRTQPQSYRDIYRRVLISRPLTYPHSTETEDRGDITRFYNVIFLPVMKDFIKKTVAISYDVSGGNSADVAIHQSVGSGTNSFVNQWAPNSTLLSPMPVRATPADVLPQTAIGGASLAPSGVGGSGATDVTQARRLASNRNIFISPVKHQVNLSPKRVVFTVGRNTGKDLQDVNLMISSAERRASMANLTMGLKRPGSAVPSGPYLSTPSGLTVTQSPVGSIGPRTVTLVGSSGSFATKRLDFDI